jgi:hypothetical protein
MKNYVVCLKHGTKYSAEYVNTLYNMVSRNLTIDYEFVCITEDHNNINPQITILPLRTNENISGWWYKPMVFDPELGLEGNILFLDLDIVIFNNIDKLFTYESEKFCIIKDYYLKKKGKKGMNSSCFRFKSGTNQHVYYDFINQSDSIMKRLAGDQDWMQETILDTFIFWPEEWVMSYKWEMYKESDIHKRTNNTYEVTSLPMFKKESCISVFHGYPKPHQIINAWCSDNWR